MRISLLLLIVVAALAGGCSQDNEVVGTWTFDLEATTELLQKDLEERAPGAARKAMRDDALNLIKEKLGPPLKLTLDLKEDGVCEGTLLGGTAATPFVGKWKREKEQVVVSREGSDPQRLDYEGDKLLLRIPIRDPKGGSEQTWVRAVLKKT